MNATTKNKQEASTDELLNEIKRLRGESRIKDVLLTIVPLLVAGLSIYFSNQNAERQLLFSNTQLVQTREIENAKLLESFSQRILNGGKEAELARLALDSVRLTESQKIQLSKFFEEEAGGSDQPQEPPSQPSSSEQVIDSEFEKLLSRLFSPEREVRAKAYTTTKNYLINKKAEKLIGQMIAKVYSDPFNIKGRSNVLSILDSLPVDKLMSSKDELLSFFLDIEHKGALNPAYAVGPQTTGWISGIRGKLAKKATTADPVPSPQSNTLPKPAT